MAEPRIHCPYCGRISGLVWVHGHAQCEACGTNVDECCRGEQAPEDPEDEGEPGGGDAGPARGEP